VRANNTEAEISIDQKKNKDEKQGNSDGETDADDPVVNDILGDDVDNAKWSTEEKDNLPDKSFAVIEKGYEPGKSPKSARHLPYKNADGEIDLPHLKNAWDRKDEIKSVLHTESDEELRARATKVLSGPYKKHFGDKVKDQKKTKADNSKNESSGITSEFNNSEALGHVRQTWRLISAVKAWPHSGFEDPQLVDYAYQDGAVLKNTVDHINKNKPDLLWNHSDDAHDVAGYVENARWEDSTDIPAGVNADLVVDPAYDHKAALGLQKGFIRNGSIGVQMDCRPSHPKMQFSQFVKNQGKAVDGDIVRWVPVRITEVRHMALVPSGTGADPNAGRRFVNSSNRKIDEMISQTVTEVKNENNNPGGEIMETWIAMLTNVANSLGIEVALAEGSPLPDGLEERINKKLEQFKALNEKYNKLCVSVEKLAELACNGVAPASFDETLGILENKIAMAAHGEKLLEHYRKDATKWFDSAKAALDKKELSDSEKRMRNRILKSADLDYLEDVVAEYKAITEANLSSKRVSEGVELPVTENKIVDDRKIQDILASSARLFKSPKTKTTE
jgi:hypothetical protein